MNKKEIFSKVSRHLLEQKKKSKAGKRCAYRSRDGLKCAIGCLIPDEIYSPNIESYSVCHHRVMNLLKKVGISEYQIEFLIKLQTVHDDHPARSWKKQLANIANCYKIPTKALDEIETGE